MYQDTQKNNKRILKNSILLYIRLAIVLVGNLYISRIVLDNLGTSDYGLYNVVGGFVMMFTIITSSLAAATSRYITFELGKNDSERLRTVFSISVSIHILLAVILFVLLESLGTWYLNSRMVIDTNRMVAANYVLQFSIVTLLFNILNIPYNAALMAHEHMDFYAYVSIFDVFFKLMICIALPYIYYDSLIVYAFLVMVVSVLVRVIYIWYCKRHFPECRYTIRNDREMLKGIFKFSGWNFIGATSGIMKRHGNNIVLNLFFGTVVNAAYSLSIQVTSAVSNFSAGILNAFSPQIIKQYSVKNMDYMFKLVFIGSRASFYLMMLVFIPVYLNVNDILSLWLKEVPPYTSIFLKISLITSMVETWSGPLITAMLATGDIKTYQLVVGGADIMCLPLSYIFLSLGMPPVWVFVVMLFISILTLNLRLIMLKRMINLPARTFLVKIVGRSGIICVVTLLASFFICSQITMKENVLYKVFIYSVICFCVSIVMIALFDTTRSERSFVLSFIRKKSR